MNMIMSASVLRRERSPRMRTLIAIALMLLVAVPAAAEKLEGTVLSADTGTVLPDALVTMYANHHYVAVVSNGNGHFELLFPPSAKSVKLRVRLAGYST